MPRVSKNALTKADLEWFDLSRYRSEVLYGLDLSGWIKVLTDRLVIQDALARGDPDLALEGFSELRQDPVSGGNPPIAVVRGSHETDTTTVFLTPVGALQVYAIQATLQGLNAADRYDIATRPAGATWRHGTATVSIDLGASRDQVKNDFNRWLDRLDSLAAPQAKKQVGKKYRRYTAKTFEDWIEWDSLPYFDLQLFAAIRRQPIPPTLLAAKLNIAVVAKTKAPDALRTTAKGSKAFTWQTAYEMWRQRDGEMTIETSRPH